MTLFKCIIEGAGLSQREAARFLGVSYDTSKSWCTGRRTPAPGVFDDLHDLIDRQERAAQAAFDVWQDQGCPPEIEIGIASDDYEAQGLGWPCVSAHMATARRIWEMVGDEAKIIIVPRGSTITTAAAEIISPVQF